MQVVIGDHLQNIDVFVDAAQHMAAIAEVAVVKKAGQ